MEPVFDHDRERRRPVEVLHSAEVGGCRLRWFASPIWVEHGAPDHPWHSFDDLCIALALPESMLIDIRRGLKTDWARETRTIAVADGSITTIAPHFAAQGMFAALRYPQRLITPERRKLIERAYYSGQVAALFNMTAHMSGIERLAFAIAGWR